jgi:hypothetical protein
MVVVVILVTGVAAIFLYGLYEIRPGSSASGSSSGTETGTMPLSTASSITLESSATTTSNSSTTGLATSASQSRASSSETLTTTQPGQHISSASGICVAGNTKSYQDRILLTYGLIATGLWNLRSASGDVRMCYQPSGINATIGLTNVTAGLVQPGDFVGYPEVAY